MEPIKYSSIYQHNLCGVISLEKMEQRAFGRNIHYTAPALRGGGGAGFGGILILWGVGAIELVYKSSRTRGVLYRLWRL